jgi:D-3-phosphoglycerate dehydrogenase
MPTLSFTKDKIKVLLLEGIHDSAAHVFQDAGYSNVTSIKTALDADALKAELAGTHIVGIRSRTQLTSDMLAAAPKLFAAGCFCIGTNQVDLNAAEHKGVPVFNAPFANTRSVAELVLAQMVLLLRQVPHKSAMAHQGIWLKSADNSFEVRGKTLGIIGYGHIGSQLSVLAEGLGLKVLFHDIEKKLPLGNASQVKDLDALLKHSDIVSLHVPDTAQTRNMITATHFSAMKKSVVFVNASRGQVVDVDALAHALKAKHVLGAAVDVFPVEPASNTESFSSPLQGLDNVILTPHVGGSTQEAQVAIGVEVAEKLVKYSDNGSTFSAVNFPQVALPTHEGFTRMMHIHHNQPGVMNAINDVFAKQGANIVGQYLHTTAAIGYVVMDVAIENSKALVDALKGIEGTVRARVLF